MIHPERFEGDNRMKEQNQKYSKGTRHLLRIVLIALFAGMAYVALTVFRIPYPAPVGTPFIHLGNMVVILAALLIGGWQGGLSGSIGMGLFDLIFYPTSAFKTVILKFGIGLFTGLVARLGRGEKSRHPDWGLGTASAVSLVIGGILLFGKLSGQESFAAVPAIACVFLLTLGVLLALVLLVAVCRKKGDPEILFAILGAVSGIAFNVAGEFVFGTVEKVLAGSALPVAMGLALASLPATFINGAFSIVGAILLYVPIKAALHRAHLDDLLVK